mgnify:CR=1 FL=1
MPPDSDPAVVGVFARTCCDHVPVLLVSGAPLFVVVLFAFGFFPVALLSHTHFLFEFCHEIFFP